VVKKLLGFGFLLLSVVTLSAFSYGGQDNSLVRFDGGIGVIPVSNVV
jgi:hypothetical protein